MLAKIEALYLAILRVVILAVASIALLVAVLALISVAGPLTRQLGLSSKAEVQGGALADYIKGRAATVSVGQSPVADSSPPPTTAPPESIKKAAQNIWDYTRQSTVMQWEKVLGDSAGDISDNVKDDYYDSVLSASNELRQSTGQKLTAIQVLDYIAWNRQQFVANSGEIALRHAGDAAKLTLALYAAAASFFFFIMIVFVFIFVKIERSLRVVRTFRVETQDE